MNSEPSTVNRELIRGINTQGLFPDLHFSQIDILLEKARAAGYTHFRFPGGATIAKNYSYAHALRVDGKPFPLFNDYNDRYNPGAYAWALESHLRTVESVSLVFNLNRQMSFLGGGDKWFEKNIELFAFFKTSIPVEIALIELGNEVYYEPIPKNVYFFRQEAKKYIALVRQYQQRIPDAHARKLAVTMAPEVTNYYRAWNEGLRQALGSTVQYVYHYYARPDTFTAESVHADLQRWIGPRMPQMHLTEMSWKYEEGMSEDIQRARVWMAMVRDAAARLDFKSVYDFKLGDGKENNPYNLFQV
jgi:hypothetical protein